MTVYKRCGWSGPEHKPGFRMTRVALQVMSLFVLRLLTGRAATVYPERDGFLPDTCPLSGASRCISDKLQRRWERVREKNRVTVSRADTHTCDQIPQATSRRCDQLIKDLHESPRKYHEKNLRSLSPWEYSLDQDETRFPRVISVAQCLCDGCIIRGQEDLSYVSVPVCSRVMVLWRRKCPCDPNQYVIRKGFVSVAVGCTCVRPKY